MFSEQRPVESNTLQRMNDTLVRRGPDQGGTFLGKGVGLAMRRLSIIDLSGGQQPIHNEDSSVWIVFNGEIYNYRELRDDLLLRGHKFETNSDTEVIVHLYEEYGDDLVKYLRGMFAFAIWDIPKRRGLVVRDRLGIKPLFYAQSGDTLVFGSEIKAVLASGLPSKKLDYQALDAFFTFTYIPAPLTIYTDVRKLEPGHLLVFESGRIEKKRYWDLDAKCQDEDSNWEERFDKAIEDAVESHLVSDVPIGAFLSGGIDSSLVVALMSQHTTDPVQTFTMGFGGSKNPLLDERPLAAKVASRYGCHFREYLVQPDFRDIVGDIANAFDEPFADDSVVPSYYISQFTRQHVKVALSGLGGDELFGGYERYSGVLLGDAYGRLVPESLHRLLVNPAIQRLPEPALGGDRVNHAKRFASAVMRTPAQRYLSLVSTIGQSERRRLFTSHLAQEIDFARTDKFITEPYENCNAPDDVARALYVDMKTYLPEDILALSDRLSMWHSLELRVPLIDHELVELSCRLPTRFKLNWKRKKILLKKIASRYLPPEIINHRKQGFESPMGAWLRTDLSGYARQILGKDRIGKTGLFDNDYVTNKLDEHLSGRHKNNKLLFSLIMFQEWYERHVA